jgi:hypothetical protein
MTEHELITLGYRYGRATGESKKELHYQFGMILNHLLDQPIREEYIYLFNRGIEEARNQVGRNEYN